MSFEADLMGKAQQIQQKAIDAEVEDFMEAASKGRRSAGAGSGLSVEEYQKYAEKDFADVSNRYRPFAAIPDPALFRPFLEDALTAMRSLSLGAADGTSELGQDGTFIRSNSALGSFQSLMLGNLDTWTGHAAGLFRDNYISPFPSIVANQFKIATMIYFGFAAQQKLWESTRKDIMGIADQTLVALDAMDDCGDNEWAIGFTVASAIAGLIAAPLDGVALITMTGVSGFFSIVGTMGPHEKANAPIQGETPRVVINSMRDAITQLTHNVNAEQERVRRALAAALVDIEAPSAVSGDHPAYLLPRPLITASNRRNFKDYFGEDG